MVYLVSWLAFLYLDGVLCVFGWRILCFYWRISFLGWRTWYMRWSVRYLGWSTWYFHHIKYEYFVLYFLDKLCSEQTLWHSLWWRWWRCWKINAMVTQRTLEKDGMDICQGCYFVEWIGFDRCYPSAEKNILITIKRVEKKRSQMDGNLTLHLFWNPTQSHKTT